MKLGCQKQHSLLSIMLVQAELEGCLEPAVGHEKQMIQQPLATVKGLLLESGLFLLAPQAVQLGLQNQFHRR